MRPDDTQTEQFPRTTPGRVTNVPNNSHRSPRRWPGVLGMIVLLLVALSACGACGAAFMSAGPSTQYPAPEPVTALSGASAGASSAPSTAPRDGTFAYGAPSLVGDIELTVSAPKKNTTAYIGTQYCSTVTYRNTGTTPDQISMFDWNFRSSEGMESSSSIPFGDGKSLDSGELRAGGKTSGRICSSTDISDVTAVVYSPGFGIMNEAVFQ